MTAVSIQGLSQRFGATEALRDVSLEIPAGCVFGLLGLNGAGKTTLLRHMLGLHRPRSGTVRVLGEDPIRDRETVMRNVGYLSEEDSLPTWMRVSDVLRFCGSIYPSWDTRYARELADWFELSIDAKLKTLSKGGRARVGLIAAIAHRPELLILDEPSSGLDPIARGDILEAIIRTVSLDGRTVVFSSHLLEEVNRVCDRVAVVHEGKLLRQIDMSQVGSSFQEWVLRPRSSEVDTTYCPLADALDWRGIDGEWSTVVESPTEDDSWEVQWEKIEQRDITLDRLFVALVGKTRIESERSSMAPTVEVSA
ncbi:MAG: ABC transporter ATP-binding protein [Planctomycetota bacterium]